MAEPKEDAPRKSAPGSCVRSKFSKTDDEMLIALVKESTEEGRPGDIDWKKLAEKLGRTSRQCRERYRNYLSPDLDNRPWSKEEDARLKYEVERIGCRWVRMAKEFQGRSHVSLKNRWSLLEYRRIHAPRNVIPIMQKFRPILQMSEVEYLQLGEPEESPWVEIVNRIFRDDESSIFLSDTVVTQPDSEE